MALFFVGYLLAVASTVAFIVAILTPKWIYPNNLPVSDANPASPAESNYQGIFYVDQGFANNTCRDWILTPKDSVNSCRPSMFTFWYYFSKRSFCLAYAVACASLAIVASSLSIILLWLAGAYLYIRRRRLAPHFVTFLAALTLLICKSSDKFQIDRTSFFLSISFYQRNHRYDYHES